MTLPFLSPYTHGFVRVAAAVPLLKVADPAYNAAQTVEQLDKAADAGAALVAFPELGLSAYSIDDLVQQDALLDGVLAGLATVCAASRRHACLAIVGAPLRFGVALYNCAVVVQRGRVLGVVPKTYLPNYREFYEKRHFAAARHAPAAHVDLFGESVPFGNDLVFEAEDRPDFRVHVEVCEDVWVPVPPSTWAALGGATVLVNLSASNVTIGKSDYRRLLCTSHSARCLAAYVYTASGSGESTTDLAWDGQALIAENGGVLAESERFRDDGQLIVADVDLERLRQDRMRMTTFADQAADEAPRVRALRRVAFPFEAPANARGLHHPVARFPYVPADPATRDQRCWECYNIQVHGLAQRLRSTRFQHLVIGVSGGLDSTHALLVACETMDRLGLPRRNILAYTMPGFATGAATLRTAHALMGALDVSATEIDIRPSCMQMLRDIDHPYARGEHVFDTTFENVQAGERTSHLFRLANRHRALVLGTGDLSELALGWCTYGVGDQMSHYNVNGSVPKTLIQFLLRWVISTGRFPAATTAVLQTVVDTIISPELVPAAGADDAKAMQSSEAVIGPYELQDFHLYYTTRFGFRPSKVAFLAHHAWSDPARGAWPDLIPADKRHAYPLKTIRHWLHVFLDRFFRGSQFKRSAMPNGPKVGSGGSLSPRGDWRAPSDSGSAVWLDELARNVPDDA